MPTRTWRVGVPKAKRDRIRIVVRIDRGRPAGGQDVYRIAASMGVQYSRAGMGAFDGEGIGTEAEANGHVLHGAVHDLV